MARKMYPVHVKEGASLSNSTISVMISHKFRQIILKIILQMSILNHLDTFDFRGISSKVHLISYKLKFEVQLHQISKFVLNFPQAAKLQSQSILVNTSNSIKLPIVFILKIPFTSCVYYPVSPLYLYHLALSPPASLICQQTSTCCCFCIDMGE